MVITIMDIWIVERLDYLQVYVFVFQFIKTVGRDSNCRFVKIVATICYCIIDKVAKTKV